MRGEKVGGSLSGGKTVDRQPAECYGNGAMGSNRRQNESKTDSVRSAYSASRFHAFLPAGPPGYPGK